MIAVLWSTCVVVLLWSSDNSLVLFLCYAVSQKLQQNFMWKWYVDGPYHQFRWLLEYLTFIGSHHAGSQPGPAQRWEGGGGCSSGVHKKLPLLPSLASTRTMVTIPIPWAKGVLDPLSLLPRYAPAMELSFFSLFTLSCPLPLQLVILLG